MKALELHAIVGQSNAQGVYGNGEGYPPDPESADKKSLLYYNAPDYGNSEGKWVAMQSQSGMWQTRHFGPEVEFSRCLVRSGRRPAIFKFSKPCTNLRNDWKRPGQGGLYDEMCQELRLALAELENLGEQFMVSSFTWIQGESDAETEELASSYPERLEELMHHIKHVLNAPMLPIILGVDEDHPWVMRRQEIVTAQLNFVSHSSRSAFLSMKGLEKVDDSHLTPRALFTHGKRLFEAYLEASAASPIVQHAHDPTCRLERA